LAIHWAMAEWGIDQFRLSIDERAIDDWVIGDSMAQSESPDAPIGN
jgi:hypothetical protein